VVDNVALGKIFLQALPFSPDSIIPPILHSHLDINSTLRRRTSGRSLGAFKQRNVLPAASEHGKERFFRFLFASAELSVN
jgi:hypothetical protein